MTGRIIRFRGRQPQDAHREAQQLLPWYATGRLDEDDRDLVEAHLRQCADCRAELELERRLDVEVAELPTDVDQAWAAMRPRLRRRSGRGVGAASSAAADAVGAVFARPAPWLGWAFAAQFAALLAVGALALRPPAQPAAYHALGAAPPPASGNVIVSFQPDLREQDLRAALNETHARLVDGPTAADAYVLHVPPGERAAALSKLRHRPGIVLAEPIDPAGTP